MYLRHVVKIRDLINIIEDFAYMPQFMIPTRRLQKGELPYPGYCRSPGSGKCLPILCNCEKLLKMWKEMKKNT